MSTAVLAARKALDDLEAEDRAAAERLRKIAAAPQIDRDDVVARENAERRRRHIVHDRDGALSRLSSALAEERAAVRAGDGIEVVFGNLMGPGEFRARSSFTLESAHAMPGPRPLPTGSRVRAVAGLGLQVALTDAPTDEALPLPDVSANHSVMSAQIIQRPELVGQKGVEGVLLTVGASAPGQRSAASGSTVREMRLVCGQSGLLGLRVETGRGTLLVPAWNVAFAVLDAPDFPGQHFIVIGGWNALRLFPRAAVATAIRPWAAQFEPLPAMRVSNLEARDEVSFILGKTERVFETIGQDQGDVQMETAGDVGVALAFHNSAQVVPWFKIRCAMIETATSC